LQRKVLLDKRWREWSVFESKLVIEFLRKKSRMTNSQRESLRWKRRPMKVTSRILGTTHLKKGIAEVTVEWAAAADKTFPICSHSLSHHPALIKECRTSTWDSVESLERRYGIHFTQKFYFVWLNLIVMLITIINKTSFLSHHVSSES
jgi:hypothetical protein